VLLLGSSVCCDLTVDTVPSQSTLSKNITSWPTSEAFLEVRNALSLELNVGRFPHNIAG
jgi:hypothetical protein